MKIEKEIEIEIMWEASTNSDLNEGRGHKVTIAYCKEMETAARLVKKRGVQGTSGYVDQVTLYKIDGKYYCPCSITYPSKEDFSLIAENKAKKAALEKARSLGLTDEEINALKWNTI